MRNAGFDPFCPDWTWNAHIEISIATLRDSPFSHDSIANLIRAGRQSSFLEWDSHFLSAAGDNSSHNPCIPIPPSIVDLPSRNRRSRTVNKISVHPNPNPRNGRPPPSFIALRQNTTAPPIISPVLSTSIWFITIIALIFSFTSLAYNI